MSTTEVLIPTAVITVEDGQIHVSTQWPGVDRPNTGGWLVGPDTAVKRNLAQRLANAINAGVVHQNPKIATDTNGKTYVAATRMVMGKYMNADLTRLGF